MGRTTTHISRLPFIADPTSIDRNQGRQIDWANVAATYQATPQITQSVVVGAAGAAGNATTVPVDATTYAIPSGTLLDFGAKKFARLSADALAGATSLTVDAIATALVDNDAATHIVQRGSGKKTLPAGTAVGELLGSGKISPRIVTTNPATGFLETTAVEDEPQAALSGYGMIVGGVLFENLLPDATGGPPKTLASAIKTELAAAGTGFSWQVYGDSRT